MVVGFPRARSGRGSPPSRGSAGSWVCNGAEGEPGTFKDRALLRANPYQLVEGVAIAAFAIGAAEAFVCLKASFRREIDAVTRAVQELQTAGFCGDCKVTIVAGPDEYLFGEEKAMLEVIEGNEPLPSWPCSACCRMVLARRDARRTGHARLRRADAFEARVVVSFAAVIAIIVVALFNVGAVRSASRPAKVIGLQQMFFGLVVVSAIAVPA